MMQTADKFNKLHTIDTLQAPLDLGHQVDTQLHGGWGQSGMSITCHLSPPVKWIQRRQD